MIDKGGQIGITEWAFSETHLAVILRRLRWQWWDIAFPRSHQMEATDAYFTSCRYFYEIFTARLQPCNTVSHKNRANPCAGLWAEPSVPANGLDILN